MLKAYKYRLYPTEDQETLLSQHFGSVRWLYNYGLEAKTKAYEEGEKLSCFDLIKRLPSLKKEFDWLKQVNSQSLQSTLRNLDVAYKKFFSKKSKFPKFKKKTGIQSFQCPQGCGVDFDKGVLKLPKFQGGIQTKFHRKFVGEIKTVTVSKTCSGKYYASILIEDGKEIPKKSLDNGSKIGIDLGIKEFAVLSTGEKIKSPKSFIKKELRIKKLNRKLQKKKKGGKNRNKVRIKLAKMHEHISNKRSDFLHKLSAKIAYESQVNTILVEDLKVSEMLKNRRLSKLISDSGWSMFINMLNYKTNWAGKNLIKIDRYFASSKTCHNCGNVKDDLKLTDRIYKCACGYEEDRDLNAAKNIRDFNLGKDVAFEPVESYGILKEYSFKIHDFCESGKSSCEA